MARSYNKHTYNYLSVIEENNLYTDQALAFVLVAGIVSLFGFFYVFQVSNPGAGRNRNNKSEAAILYHSIDSRISLTLTCLPVSRLRD